MHSKVPPRNRLAKVLPDQWRQFLLERGVPKRKYTAVVTVTLADGTVVQDVIIEQGWIISLSRSGLGGTFEERVKLDPREIVSMEIVQVV